MDEARQASAPFERVGRREYGYNTRQVDEFLAMARSYYNAESPSAKPITSRSVRSMAFDPAKAGYEPQPWMRHWTGSKTCLRSVNGISSSRTRAKKPGCCRSAARRPSFAPACTASRRAVPPAQQAQGAQLQRRRR
ncbi:hypothetical protein GCM10017708_39190 [Arthrobacter citreus]